MLETGAVQFGDLLEQGSQYAFVAPGDGFEGAVDIGRGHPLGHGPRNFVGHFVDDPEPEIQQMVRRGTLDLDPFGLPEGFEENVGKQVDHASIERMVFVEAHVGDGVSLGLLYDVGPVPVAMMIFEQEIPCLLFLPGVTFHRFRKDLEQAWNLHLDLGDVHVLG